MGIVQLVDSSDQYRPCPRQISFLLHKHFLFFPDIRCPHSVHWCNLFGWNKIHKSHLHLTSADKLVHLKGNTFSSAMFNMKPHELHIMKHNYIIMRLTLVFFLYLLRVLLVLQTGIVVYSFLLYLTVSRRN